MAQSGPGRAYWWKGKLAAVAASHFAVHTCLKGNALLVKRQACCCCNQLFCYTHMLKGQCAAGE